MKTEPNQLAYPCDGEFAGEVRSKNDAGLTKRELMAIEFTKALLESINFSDLVGRNSIETQETISKIALKQVDILIKQLNEER